MFTDFLYLLRRSGLKVSLTEWMTLMEALDKGLHGSSFTGFYHLCRSLLVKSEADFDRFDRYRIVEENEVMYEEFMMDDAEICIAAFGIAARVSKNAVIAAREMGIKVGMIRPITLWPFPKKAFRKAADQVKAFISVELSMGQMIDDIRLAEECIRPVYLCNRAGGMIPSPDEVLAEIEKLAATL